MIAFPKKPVPNYPEWPWRKPDDPLPTFCPKCGLPLKLRYWTTAEGTRRYLYLGCDGRGFRGLMSMLFGWAAITEIGHWAFKLGDEEVPPIYDPDTGEPIL